MNDIFSDQKLNIFILKVCPRQRDATADRVYIVACIGNKPVSACDGIVSGWDKRILRILLKYNLLSYCRVCFSGLAQPTSFYVV